MLTAEDCQREGTAGISSPGKNRKQMEAKTKTPEEERHPNSPGNVAGSHPMSYLCQKNFKKCSFRAGSLHCFPYSC